MLPWMDGAGCGQASSVRRGSRTRLWEMPWSLGLALGLFVRQCGEKGERGRIPSKEVPQNSPYPSPLTFRTLVLWIVLPTTSISIVFLKFSSDHVILLLKNHQWLFIAHRVSSNLKLGLSGSQLLGPNASFQICSFTKLPFSLPNFHIPCAPHSTPLHLLPQLATPDYLHS